MSKFIKIIMFLVLPLVVPKTQLSAQDVWSLERCLQQGLQQSLDVKQAYIGMENAKITQSLAKQARYPQLNANVNLGANFGRTIDPTTNTFETNTIGFNSFSAGAGMILFNANRINNTVKQTNLDRLAADQDVQNIQNNVSLAIVQSYMQILFADEQLANTNLQLAQVNEQLKLTEKLIKAGSRPENDKFDVLAQIATVEQSIVAAQNNVDLSYLNLKQLLQIDAATNMKIEKPNINITSSSENLAALEMSNVFSQAVGLQPQIKAGEIRLKSAQIGEKIAKSAFYPTITAFGNFSSNYSSLGRDFQNPDLSNATLVEQTPVPVLINGSPSLLTSYGLSGIVFPKQGYFTQLEQNFGQALGLGISIPIYSNGQVKGSVQRARINVINSEIQNMRNRQQLKSDVQQAIANAKAAQKTLDASEKTASARKIAFQNAEKRYNIGVSNIFEVTTAKNNLDTAETNLLIAKYDYLFKLKIVDFYQGKKLTL